MRYHLYANQLLLCALCFYETEADKFAMELLVPNDIILENWKTTTEQLSRLTGYSEKLIRLRLK